MATATTADYAALADWLRGQTRVLVATHTKPDGDAFGSAIGAALLLRDLGVDAQVWVRDPLPERYETFRPDCLLEGAAVDTSAYSGLLCLDSARANRTELPGGRTPEEIGLPVANVDHHIDNPGYGALNVVDASKASTCEMLAHLAESQGLAMAADTATVLMVGVMSDTGGMRFSNTTADTFRLSAWLLDQGASHETVTKALFFSDPYGYIKLQGHVIDTMKQAFDGRLVYFALESDALERFGVTNSDSEDLIDTIRGIRGVDIACRMHAVDEGVRFSFRSMNRDLPILPLAHAIGGGGHAMAAGATGEGMTLADAESTLLRLVEELLSGSPS